MTHRLDSVAGGIEHERRVAAVPGEGLEPTELGDLHETVTETQRQDPPAPHAARVALACGLRLAAADLIMQIDLT